MMLITQPSQPESPTTFQEQAYSPECLVEVFSEVRQKFIGHSSPFARMFFLGRAVAQRLDGPDRVFLVPFRVPLPASLLGRSSVSSSRATTPVGLTCPRAAAARRRGPPLRCDRDPSCSPGQP